MIPIKNPTIQVTSVTSQRFQLGNWSHAILVTQEAREVALPTPSVNNIRKNKAAKSCKLIKDM